MDMRNGPRPGVELGEPVADGHPDEVDGYGEEWGVGGKIDHAATLRQMTS